MKKKSETSGKRITIVFKGKTGGNWEISIPYQIVKSIVSSVDTSSVIKINENEVPLSFLKKVFEERKDTTIEFKDKNENIIEIIIKH